MYTKVYWIEQFPNGSSIGIMPRPRGHEWLINEIKMFKKNGIRAIVSLLEKLENQELGLQSEEALCKANEISFISFPIQDRRVPKSDCEALTLVNDLMRRLHNGERIIIHCRMGIGRSSIIAGCVLIHLGKKTNNILENISRIRAMQVPDTEEQVQWLKRIESSIKINSTLSITV
jgi:protein-tyrosine phosphatase